MAGGISSIRPDCSHVLVRQKECRLCYEMLTVPSHCSYYDCFQPDPRTQSCIGIPCYWHVGTRWWPGCSLNAWRIKAKGKARPAVDGQWLQRGRGLVSSNSSRSRRRSECIMSYEIASRILLRRPKRRIPSINRETFGIY